MSPRHRVGVVVNPAADQGRAAGAGAVTLARLREAGVDVVELSGASFDDALARASAAVAAGLDALVVVGGDGMVHLGVNAVAQTGVPLGVVAAGSGNDLAHAVGLPVHAPAAAVRVVLDALDGEPPSGPAGTTDERDVRACPAGRVRALDLAHVRPLPGSDAAPRWYAGVLSAGLDAAVNATANAVTWPRGRARYAVAVLRELRRFAPFGYRVRTHGAPGVGPTAGVRPGEVWEQAGTLVAVANGPRIGGGIQIAPGAALDDGLLDVVLAGPFSRLGAVRIFPLTYVGQHVRHPRVEVRRTCAVTLEATTEGTPPPAAFADGERVGTLPLAVAVVPGALRLLVPGPGALDGGATRAVGPRP